MLIGAGEAGAHTHLGKLQLVQAALGVGQPLGKRSHRPARPRRQPAARDPQRQRQPPAQAGHLGGFVGLDGHPLLADQPDKQLDRLTGRQHPEVDMAGAVQGSKGPTAGHQHPTAGSGGQQWCDLRGIRGVVQHHQQAAVGHPRAEHAAGLLQVGGDGGGVGAERTQEPAQDLQRRQGLQAGDGAVQVHE